MWLTHRLHKAFVFQKCNENLVEQFNNYQNTVTLYEKLGGAQTVSIAVDNAVSALLAEPSLSNVFSVVGTTGHRTGAQLKSCLDAQFSALMGSPLPYPSKTISRGAIVKARSMRDSHKNLNLGITQAQFDKFVSILATSLVETGVPQTEVNALAPGLVAMSSDIIGNAS